MIIVLFLLIIIVLLVLLSMNYYFNNNREKFENINETKIHPVIEIAKETTKLEAVKKENKDITDITDKLVLVKVNLEKKIAELNNTIEEKNKAKIKLEDDIAELDKQKIASLSVFDILKYKIDKTVEKDIQLKEKEQELNKKENDLGKVIDIKDKQNMTAILGKLNEISKNIEETNKESNDNQFCLITKEMPKPIFKTNNDMSYKWCMCNDINKKSESCINYFNCKLNYDTNKEKTNLSGNDLDVYFKCIDLYSDFPKYINK